MPAKLTTPLRNYLLGSGALFGGFGTVALNIYSGPIPEFASDAVTGDLLVSITDAGGSGTLPFDAPENGALPKAAAGTWSGTAVATGTATFFRFVDSGFDDGMFTDVDAMRLQGTVGLFGADLNMTDVNIVDESEQTIEAGQIRMPAE